MDWEMKARQMAEDMQVLAVVLGLIAIVGFFGSSGWAAWLWAAVCWLAVSGYAGARIEP